MCCIVCCLPGGGAGVPPVPPHLDSRISHPFPISSRPSHPRSPPSTPPARAPPQRAARARRRLRDVPPASRPSRESAHGGRRAARAPSAARAGPTRRTLHLQAPTDRCLSPGRGKSIEIQEETPESWPLWTRGPRGAQGQHRSLLDKALGLGPALQKGDAFAPGLLAQHDSRQLRRTGAGESVATADECSHPGPSVTCLEEGQPPWGGASISPTLCCPKQSLAQRVPPPRLPYTPGCWKSIVGAASLSPHSGVAHDTEPLVVEVVADVSLCVKVLHSALKGSFIE